MTVSIPESHRHLLEEPVYANLSTIMPDGRPQVHPVWCDFDGTYVRVNSAKGRQKDQNMRERDYATILLLKPDDPYYWMEIRGHVAQMVEGDEADAHIDSLAKKYLGKERYPGHTPDETRVIYKIEPDRVLTVGNGE
ncbi:MAG TPA: PPOX class F420-dependent oxidoreductase [Candidatus Sulfomarinibacteraceae bacterium]|nr:PPOX class F420-dependent oxidoreductase [Candidatus Sulfomarinibacteraceae bacterium]